MAIRQTANDEAAPPTRNAGEENLSFVPPDPPIITTSPLREDEIGVVFDYVPPPATYYPDNSPNSTPNGRSRQSRSHNHRRQNATRRHRSRHHHHHRRRRQEEHFLRTYAKHWISQCVAAVLTGTIFLAIGIALTTIQVATYIGIMFILVSLPSFFMAIHMVRSRMRQRRMRRIYRERRQRRATRRRQRAAENAAFRGAPLPYSDLPPAYDNLAFNEAGGEFEISGDGENLSISTISEDSEIPPPIYDDEWDKVSLDAKDVTDLADPETTTKSEIKLNPSFTSENDSETEDPIPQNPHCSYNTE